jgi:MFS family permease
MSGTYFKPRNRNLGLIVFGQLSLTNRQDLRMSNYKTRLKVRKSLKYSVLDGAAYSGMAGFTQNYITPFALALKATTVQIGLLSSFPNFAVALSQLVAPYLVERTGSRKGVILAAVFIHAIMWLPVFIVPCLFPESGVWWLIGLFTIGAISDALANPAWRSMMGDLVHEKIRGRYFSFRNRIVTFTILIFSVIAGLILGWFTENVFIGFAMLFGGAMVFRFLSLYFFSKMYEPISVRREQQTESLVHIIKNLRNSNIGKFTIFMSLLYFVITIPGPFFSVYMLRDLQISYTTYTFINAASTVATLLFLTFWGRRADRAGNVKIMKITATLVPFVPLLWLVNGNPWYLMAVNFFSGAVWAGFDLSSANFVLDVSSPEIRTKQVAVFNAITCLAISFGTMAGGFIAPHLPEILGYQLRTLFTISGILRGIVILLFIRTLVEVRHVPSIGVFRLLFGHRDRGN